MGYNRLRTANPCLVVNPHLKQDIERDLLRLYRSNLSNCLTKGCGQDTLVTNLNQVSGRHYWPKDVRRVLLMLVRDKKWRYGRENDSGASSFHPSKKTLKENGYS